MFAYFLDNFSPYIFKFGENFGPRWYGFAYVMAFVCGYWLYTWLAKHGYTEMPAERVGDFITWGALFGVMLGGRLGYVLFYKLHDYKSHPLDIFKLWDGGMASHGGMLGLILFTLYYARRHKYSWPGIGDSLCVVAPIGLFFGRCANFINGELYGHPSTAPWAVLFPKEILEWKDASSFYAKFGPDANLDAMIQQSRHDAGIHEAFSQILTPRHPSQLYEAFLEGIVLFCALWFLRTKVRSPRGVLTGMFFILYAFLRIIGENFRVPDAAMTGLLTRGQFLSLFLILIGLAFVIYGMITKHYEQADLAKTRPVKD